MAKIAMIKNATRQLTAVLNGMFVTLPFCSCEFVDNALHNRKDDSRNHTKNERSKIELQRKLNDSWADACCGYPAKRRIRHRRVRVCKLRRIESVEELCAKLDICTLSRPSRNGAFDERK